MKANGTLSYARLHKRGLTLPQQNAVDLLAAGRTDTEAAELLKLSRPCVTRWRLYDPVFQAALNVRRAEVWGAGLDRLRALIPKALDALGDALDSGHLPTRLKAAAALLRTARPPAGADFGPTEADDIVRRVVAKRRNRVPDALDDLLAEEGGLPSFDRHVEQVWQELEARAAGSDDEGANS
jgi:hypothetical protein